MNNPSRKPAIDLTRAPRGELVASELVEAVAFLGDLAERHFLEVKGPDDLKTARDKQKIAKFVLGAANRMPDKASEAFEGCCVMVIGVRKDKINGLPPIEMLELNQVVEQFTGPNGPKWDIVRVPVRGSHNQVLLVIVEPPKQGQPAFICRANGEGLADGAIYIRADGETRQAKSAELDLLRTREIAPEETAPVELDVVVTADVIPIRVDESRTVDEYIDRSRTRLLNALPKPTSKDWSDTSAPGISRQGTGFASVLAGLGEVSTVGHFANILGSVPEERTEDEYRAEIADWETQFRAAWPGIVVEMAGYAFDAAEISILNGNRTYIHDLVVKLHLEGAVQSIDSYGKSTINSSIAIAFPPPPRAWGPTQRDHGLGYLQGLTAGVQPRSFDFRPPDSVWTNSGSVDVKVAVGDLPPEEEFITDDQSSVLVIFGDAPEVVHGTWRATARGYNRIFEDETWVSVAEPKDLTDALRAFLRLDDSIGGQ